MMRDRSEHSQHSFRLPFGVKLLAAAGIVFVVVMVVRQVTVVPARGELDATLAMQRLGCEIDWHNPPDEIETPFGSYRRSWFAEILGKKYFSSIGQIRIRRGVEEDLARYTAQLRSYEEAVALLRGTSISDAGVKGFAKVPRLRAVDLSLTQVGNLGVKELAAAADLESLSLEHSPVTDAAVASLIAMPKLRDVNLEGTDVSDQAAERLKKAKPKLIVKWATAPSEAARVVAAKIAAIPGIAIRTVRTASGEKAYAAAIEWNSFSGASPYRDSDARMPTTHVLEELSQLPHLARLTVPGIQNWFSAKEIDALAKLQSLRDLSIEDGWFIDTLRPLSRLTSLRRLTLKHCISPRTAAPMHASAVDSHEYFIKATNARKGTLGAQPPAFGFWMHRPPSAPSSSENRKRDSDDDWLAFVTDLPNLEVLDLSRTHSVTLAALKHLQRAPKLREVAILTVPAGSDEAELQQSLPNVKFRIEVRETDKANWRPQASTQLRATASERLAKALDDPEPIPERCCE